MKLGGVTYELQDRISIDQAIEDGLQTSQAVEGFSERLRKKFSEDKELIRFLDDSAERRKAARKIQVDTWNMIKADVLKRKGDLYSYRVQVKQSGAEGEAMVKVEEGWLILAHGKLYKKYVMAAGLEDDSPATNYLKR